MDARSLLRAKKAEARIEHPFAVYSARGELRCSVCAVPVKQWDAHLLTKAHRTSAAREKANQQAAAAKKAAASAASAGSSKRAIDATDGSSGEAGPSKKAKSGPAGLPEGFFSKGNAPVEEDDEDEDEDMEGGGSGGLSTSTTIAATGASAKATGDNELDDFLASLSGPGLDGDEDGAAGANVEYAISKPTQATKKSKVPRYKEVEPGQASYEAAPVRNLPVGEKEEEEKEVEPEESEKEKRDRLAREEREEIVRRSEEEERAQEDADSRVTSLKERMALLKKRREARGGVPAGKGKDKAAAGAKGSNA